MDWLRKKKKRQGPNDSIQEIPGTVVWRAWLRQARWVVGWGQGGGAVRSREEAPEAKEGIPGIGDRVGDPRTGKGMRPQLSFHWNHHWKPSSSVTWGLPCCLWHPSRWFCGTDHLCKLAVPTQSYYKGFPVYTLFSWSVDTSMRADSDTLMFSKTGWESHNCRLRYLTCLGPRFPT